MSRKESSSQPENTENTEETHVAPAAAAKLSDERRAQLEKAMAKKSQQGRLGPQSVGSNHQPHGESGAKGGKRFTHQKHGE